MKEPDKETLALAQLLQAAGYQPSPEELYLATGFCDDMGAVEASVFDAFAFDDDTRLLCGQHKWPPSYVYYCIARAVVRLR